MGDVDRDQKRLESDPEIPSSVFDHAQEQIFEKVAVSFR